ncbi:MAG: contractile injection system protein, VgrG/Pvc8 family, partial [Cyanobacteria bacterium J06641_5]
MLAIGKAVAIGFSASTTEDTAFSESAEATAIQGEIAAVEAEFNPDSQATITIRGYDVSHRLYRGRHNRSFQNKKDSDIVKDIAREVGISLGTVDDTGGPYGYEDINNKSGYVFQTDRTNMEFLRDRAARHGFEMFVTGGKLHFRKPKADDKLELKWLQDIQKFQARITSSEQVSGVEVRAWDYNQKQAIVARENSPSQELITANEFGKGKETSSAFNGQPSSPTLQVVNQIFSSQAEGAKIAQALCDETGRDFVRAEATATGNPKLCPGKAIALSDLGKYSGTYYLTQVRHHFVAGEYTTDFSV